MALTFAVIGMSHVGALAGALAKSPNPSFRIVNLRERKDLSELQQQAVKTLADEIGMVDVLCFSMRGNLHNVLSLFNHPVPFWMAPGPGPGKGQLIPQDMMRLHFERNLASMLEVCQTLAKAIPHTRRVVIQPPPPFADAEHLALYPGPFKEKLSLGVSPDRLRLQTYEIESSVFRRHASELDATFLPSRAEARTETGMLARPYWNQDPTHGNAAYGALVLDALRALAGDIG